MTNVIARSRIGFWTAFETQGGSWLNARGDDGDSVTIRITDQESDVLAGPAGPAHELVRVLAADRARHSDPLPTPPLAPGEPQAHDWWPTRRGRADRLAA